MTEQRLAYSIAQAVELTGVGRTKIYQAIKDGSLTPRKFGARTLILRDDLQRFLQSLPAIDGCSDRSNDGDGRVRAHGSGSNVDER